MTSKDTINFCLWQHICRACYLLSMTLD